MVYANKMFAKTPLRRTQVRQLCIAASAVAQSDTHLQLPQQEFCHDRLAHWVCRRAQGCDRRDEQASDPDVQPHHHFTQIPAALALNDPRGVESIKQEIRQQFEKRGVHMWKRLSELPKVTCVKPQARSASRTSGHTSARKQEALRSPMRSHSHPHCWNSRMSRSSPATTAGSNPRAAELRDEHGAD